jgi:hypothetical protein
VHPSATSSSTSARTISTASANISNGSSYAAVEWVGDQNGKYISGLGTVTLSGLGSSPSIGVFLGDERPAAAQLAVTAAGIGRSIRPSAVTQGGVLSTGASPSTTSVSEPMKVLRRISPSVTTSTPQSSWSAIASSTARSSIRLNSAWPSVPAARARRASLRYCGRSIDPMFSARNSSAIIRSPGVRKAALNESPAWRTAGLPMMSSCPR